MSKEFQRIIERMKQAAKEAEQAKQRLAPRPFLADRQEDQEKWLRQETERLRGEAGRIDTETTSKISELRAAGLELLAKQREQAELERYQAGLAAGPTSAEQWQEAAARSAFVRDDIASLAGPDDILDLYRLASGSGDTVGAYLVVHHAQRHLVALADELQADNNLMGAARAKATADELTRLHFGDAHSQYRARLAELRGIEADLNQPYGAVEGAQYKKEISDGFKVDERYVPVPDAAG